MALGVLYFLQALFQHGKNAQLIDRAKAVLDASQRSVAAVAGAFQQDGAVDHVLQHLWAGEAAVLGDVANEEQDRAGLFGEAGEIGGAFTNLGHAAGSGFGFGDMHHLNTVHYQNPGFFRFRHLHNPLDAGFRQHFQIFGGQPQAFGTHGNLLQGLLTGDIQSRNAGRQMTDGLKQQRAFAGPRVAAHQNG